MWKNAYNQTQLYFCKGCCTYILRKILDKGKLCEVVERGDCRCSGCVFYCESACKNTICQEDLRRDHNWVLFKEVADGKKKEKL